ncbi:unnamed protein product, partial [marine sediment metagenome]
GRSQHLGYFRSEDEAAKAYNQAAINLFGPFAHLNVLERKPSKQLLAVKLAVEKEN